jgi:hypothetical protein
MSLRAIRIILLALIAAELLLLAVGPQVKDHAPAIQAAESAGKRPDWWDDAAMGVHFAALINAGLFVALLATTKWWAGKNDECRLPNDESEGAVQERFRHSSFVIPSFKYFWPLVIVAMLTCLALRLPLASKSLWWDEAWVILQVNHGKWTPDKKREGELKFQAHDWSRAAWYYQKPTNHAPMSLLQKASITAWQKLTGAKRSEFSDLAARAPALLASGIAVMLLALLLRAWGRPGVGVVAAFLLALHPWHIRYGVDARAYALVVPLCIGGMLAVTRIIESLGSKIWPWLCWGLVEFVWLWAFPNAVLDLVALNVVLLISLWRTGIWKLAAVNVFAAAGFIQMFLPNFMQVRRWLSQEDHSHFLDASLFVSTVSQLFTGREAEFPGIPESAGLAGLSLPASSGFVLMLAASACLYLAWRSLSLLMRWKNERKAVHMILPALVFSALIFAVFTRVAESYFYPRFVIALLPVAIALFCYDTTESRTGRWAGLLLGVVAVLCWAPQLKVLLTRPYAPMHESLSFVQSASKDTKPLIACYGLGREVMPVYEPRCLPLGKKSEVESLLQRAKTEQRPLYVIYGYKTFNRSTENEPHRILAEGFQLLDDRSLFEEVKALGGIEPDFYFRVLKAK